MRLAGWLVPTTDDGDGDGDNKRTTQQRLVLAMMWLLLGSGMNERK